MKYCVILTVLLLSACTNAIEVSKKQLNAGKQLAFDRNKGNCLACHEIEDGESPGNIGPPLKAVSIRFKSKQQLFEQILDAARFNSETSMPPFGKNKIISEQEIDLIVDYLWNLK